MRGQCGVAVPSGGYGLVDIFSEYILWDGVEIAVVLVDSKVRHRGENEVDFEKAGGGAVQV
ncbi:hypothetical protein ANO14919_131530 [Xylariales sp. No.14919]|nr:hypothetical protein ANO14919_131530 [Xylariales sp. No.14919]